MFLELEKFKKTIDQLENLEQKWLYFFKHAEASTFAEIEHLIGSDIIIRRAFEGVSLTNSRKAKSTSVNL